MAAVSEVKFQADAFMVCLTHAFSTDREEIMGLLIGEIDEFNVSHVFTVFMLRRSDKRKDRVEISPEQLSHASTQAEQLGMLTTRKCPMRILGWYHSHPHITVWPSHVDVQTQAMYQMMDPGFVGLIFSCFNDDTASSRGQIQLTCFQSHVNSSMEYRRVEVPVRIVPSETISDACLEALEQLPDILGQEEEEVYQKTLNKVKPEKATKKNDLLTIVHNGAVFTKSLCRVIEVMCGPLMQTLENRLDRNERKTKELLREKEELERRLEAIKNA
ncbi:lys-63-specific deubiquitinase BRCC36-like [Dendronephthya gigantea]|uniref:lys-63-specific deubiquitinase BRCC36-like n=1 Tax=Dendronephthya gigantea TaxID=151771 RepID=UPI00106BE533|nr:lys-63-specific deubiquitinase BRCC36-like [Dendronephthya gigantea]XP_028413998.1 lys-63-specific deubiquitinase BRCC36-like [Dendronephthya gigantea]